jgi:signal transduction histidine kinase/ActR/RegA family two-component response regulator
MQALMLRWILAMMAAWWCVVPAWAHVGQWPLPTPQFRTYDKLQGLPSSKVHAVAQDAAGFIWVATSAGVVRFDGMAFTRPVTPAPAQAMPEDAVHLLLADGHDGLWMAGPELGVARLDTRTGAFVQWHDGLHDGEVTALALAPEGAVWMGTDHGLERIDVADGAIQRQPLDHVLPGQPIRAIRAGSDGRMWVAGRDGVVAVSSDGTVTPAPFVGDMHPRVFRIDRCGSTLCFATDAGVFRCGPDDRLRQDVRIPALPMHVAMEDAHDDLWVAGADGLSLLDRTGRFHPVRGVWTAGGGMPGRAVRDILEDREHGLWFALSDGGLAYLGPSWQDFSRFAHVASDPDSLPGRAVTAIAPRGDDQLWVGGFRGWIRSFDPAAGRASHPIFIGAVRVQALQETPSGALLAGTADGLVMASPGTPRPWLRHVIQRPVTAFASTADGTIFAAVQGQGIYALDQALASARRLEFAEQRKGALETRQIEMVDDELWQASLAGLARYDARTQLLHFIQGVAPGRVNAFEPDAGGFWVVRPDALEHYTWDGPRAVLDHVVDGSHGFPAPHILNLRRDGAGRLWLHGQTGVWRYDPATGIFRSFGLADGLANGEFTHPATVRLADGTIYGATLGGLVGFRPDMQRDHHWRAPVVLLDATVRRGTERVVLPTTDDLLQLAWDDSELIVRARVLSYVSPELNRLHFELHDGAVVTRLTTDGAGERNFGTLRYGHYLLSVSAEGPDGVLGATTRPLRIVVESPPWLRWWAWLAYVAAAGVVAAGGIGMARRRLRQNLRVRLAEHQQRTAEASNAAKTEFLATLGHEIRTPMTGVLGMAELMASTPLDETQRMYVETVRQSGATLMRLLNDALDLSRIEARRLALETQCLSPRQLAADVVALCRGLAEQKGLFLHLEVAADAPAGVVGDGVRLRQILQNLVNNALKFTERGGVTVHVAGARPGLEWQVRDTGPGMDAELASRLFGRFEQGASRQRDEGTGLGLAICHELCTLMGGAIEVESAPGAGTTFIVRLPLPSCRHVSPVDATPPTSGSAERRRVLLVEDDDVAAGVVERLLRERGHMVTHVRDGLSAMVELRARDYDTLLLDLELPSLDGLQVARMARRLPRGRPRVIIALTARSTGSEQADIAAAGMDALVRKPMTGDDLAAVLARTAAGGAASRTA